MTIDYEAAKRIARQGSYEERAALAADPALPPELLVFLAADSSESVRHALAQNPRLPSAAVRLLARDAVEKVRATIAHHVAALWPERVGLDEIAAFEPDGQSALAAEALLWLATDEALVVRSALATAIADVAVAPPEVAEMLALDAAEEVAVPILRHYSRFGDERLIDILSRRSESWARRAMAQRKTVSGSVSAALIGLGDPALTQTVLDNSGAAIDTNTYEGLVTQAETVPALQEKLAARADLPARAALRLADFVDAHVYNMLAGRGDFDAATLREVMAVARRRLDWLEGGKLPAIVRVRDLQDEGKLGDDAIRDALAWRDEEFVQLALAVKSRIYPDTVAQILKGGNAKGMVALCWRAGLSARTSLALQKGAGGIAPHQLVHPKGGTDYALTETEMLWQLEFYGVAG